MRFAPIFFEMFKKLASDIFNTGDLQKLELLIEFCSINKNGPEIAYQAINSTFQILKKYSQLNNKDYIDTIINNLDCNDCTVQITCFERLIDIIQLESEKNQEFQNSLFLRIVKALLVIKINDKLMESIAGLVNKFDDVGYYYYKNIGLL